MEKHNEFIDAITASNNSFKLSGIPNFQHFSLLNEAMESDGNIRVYSLNMDEFFDVVTIVSENSTNSAVVNAADLVDLRHSNPIFRDWRILAAHGKNIKNQQSVWSESLLVNPIDESISNHLYSEKEIINKAVECIKQGPYFNKVIFVGIAAPLVYLIKNLIDRIDNDFQWAWINPFTQPQEWLLNSSNNTFNVDYFLIFYNYIIDQ